MRIIKMISILCQRWKMKRTAKETMTMTNDLEPYRSFIILSENELQSTCGSFTLRYEDGWKLEMELGPAYR